MNNAAAKSIFVWGVYLVCLGCLLLLGPNVLLPSFGFLPTDEIWIRILGSVLVTLGYYHIQAARYGLTPFFRWSAQGRVFIVACLSAFVMLGLVKPMLLLFASADLFGALWTGRSLRNMRASNF